jgi:hypothetical protein
MLIFATFALARPTAWLGAKPRKIFFSNWPRNFHRISFESQGELIHNRSTKIRRTSVSPVYKRKNDKRARCPFSCNFTLHLNPVYPVHPCKFSRARRNVLSARHEARLSSSKRVNLVGPSAFSDEVFCAWKNNGAFRRFAKRRRGTNSKIPNSSAAREIIGHGGHQPFLGKSCVRSAVNRHTRKRQNSSSSAGGCRKPSR